MRSVVELHLDQDERQHLLLNSGHVCVVLVLVYCAGAVLAGVWPIPGHLLQTRADLHRWAADLVLKCMGCCANRGTALVQRC